jgi:butyryl-CoA dehydrogenase
MDFTLSKEHEMARQLFKEFAENEVKPLAQEVDETETFPRETVEKMVSFFFLTSTGTISALKAPFF